MKVYSQHLGHMTKMATMPIYGKKTFKNLLLRNWLTDFHETWYVALDVSEAIAACDLKIGRCRQLIEFMKVCEYSRSKSFLDLGSRSFTYENENLLFSETTGPF